MENDCDASDAC